MVHEDETLFRHLSIKIIIFWILRHRADGLNSEQLTSTKNKVPLICHSFVSAKYIVILRHVDIY